MQDDVNPKISEQKMVVILYVQYIDFGESVNSEFLGVYDNAEDLYNGEIYGLERHKDKSPKTIKHAVPLNHLAIQA